MKHAQGAHGQHHKPAQRKSATNDAARLDAPQTRRAALEKMAGTVAALAAAGCGKSDVDASGKRSTRPRKTETLRIARMPTADEQVAAVGGLESLSKRQQRFFQAGNGAFHPTREPQSVDWLAMNFEPSQTYDEWLSYRSKLAKPPHNVIDLLPLGDWNDHALGTKDLKTFMEAFFGLKVRVRQPTALQSLPVKRRKRGGQEQLQANEVNDWIQTQARPDTFCALGITMAGLYIEFSEVHFVLGQASPLEHVGVFSLTGQEPGFVGAGRRLGSGKKTQLRRSLTTLAHETGHMFGVGHCSFYDCLMNGTTSLDESDRRTAILCPICLRKLHASAGFGLERRYEQLAEIYQTHALKAEANWVRRRLAWVRSG